MTTKQLRNQLRTFVVENMNKFNIRSVNSVLNKIDKAQRKTLEALKEQFSQPATQQKLTLKGITGNIKNIKANIDKQRNFILKGDANALLNYIVSNKKPLDKSLFDNLFSMLLMGSMKNLVITDQNGNVRVMPINPNNKEFIYNILTKLYQDFATNEVGSDNFETIDLREVKSLSIENYTNKRQIQKNGAYFKYQNNTDIDLTRYNIYNCSDEQSKENCFIDVLKLYNIELKLINEVKKFIVGGTYIKKSSLKDISKIIEKSINLYTFNEITQRQDITKIGKYDNSIDVALLKSHFFMCEITKYSRFSIENYDELKNIENFHNMYKKDRYSNTQSKINSFRLVQILLTNGNFIEKDETDAIEYKEQNIDDINLSFIDDEQQLCKINEKKTKSFKTWYCDTEAYVNTGTHKLMMMGLLSKENDDVKILHIKDDKYNEDETKLTFDFLNIITNYGKNDALLYFHNLKYDYHLLEKSLNVWSKCAKDNQIYSIKAFYKKRTIEIRDSFKMLPFGLAKFCKELQLPNELHKKEAIAYEYYDYDNNDYKNTKIDDYKKFLPYELHDTFYENVKKHTTSDTTFNSMEYYKEYLKYDCFVLKAGLLKFDTLVNQITKDKISLEDCLTISSLTDKYNYFEGSYDGVYEMCRNLRDYVSRAIYGGRVCVNDKFVKKIVKGKIADYDGVSLYPSAINRLCDELGGLPTGKATRFSKNELHQWNTKIYSILTIKITKVNKKQQMPMIAIKGDITEYTNDAPNIKMVVDSITLQDYIKFHQIEYELFDGVFWNESTNKNIQSVVRELFDERVKNKKSSPSLANTLKLMLNSMYGKTILKKSDTTSIIKNNDAVDNYLFNNFNTIKEVIRINERQSEIVSYDADKSFNRSHVGVAILSMSKRIMNEVFDIANDNNINIYYTDTDSIHMDYDKTPLLEQKYFDKYNKNLNGKYLGQFHNDFSLDGAVGDIYATQSLFLGKKCYIDKIQGKDADGNDISGFHFRMKGITEAGLNYCIKTKFDNDAFKMYQHLSEGNKLNILLNPYDEETNKTKVMFEFGKGQGVKTRCDFYRELCF